MSRPRVLMDARKARDYGIGRYVVSLLTALAERGDLELLAVARPEDAPLFPAGVTLVPGLAPHYSLTELVSVRASIARVKPHLFHAPHYVVPILPPRRTVVTVHDLMHVNRPEHRAPLKRAYARVMLRRAVTSAARLITVSEATRAELAAFDRRSEGKSVAIPLAAAAAFSPAIPAEERRRVRAAHGLPARYVLCLGNDKPHKNLAGLLAAFQLLRGRVAHHLVLAGGAAAGAAGRAGAIRARGLSDVTHDLSAVPDRDVPPLVAEAAVLVLPSLAEGFGLPVLEAMACGTPVVCSDRGSLPEVAGEAALLADPGSPASLAAALERALLDEPLRRELSTAGLARAARFSWRATAERTAAVYREVLGA